MSCIPSLGDGVGTHTLSCGPYVIVPGSLTKWPHRPINRLSAVCLRLSLKGPRGMLADSRAWA
eukprot:14926759-Heterocapsa_arctica.AAC.1